MIPLYPCWGSIGGSVVKNQPTIAGTTGGLGAIPGLGRSLGEGNGNPLQHSCLGNPMDRGAWQATVHGVAKTWTWLNNWTTATPLLEWTKSGMQTSQTPVRMWANGSSRHCRWERNVVQPLWKMACWFLAKLTNSYHVIQQLYSLVFIQRNWKCMSPEKPAHGCL